LLPKIKKIPKNTNGRLAIPALAGLLVFKRSINSIDFQSTLLTSVRVVFRCIFPVFKVGC